MLQVVQYIINNLIVRLHHFSVPTLWYILANQWIFNTLLDHPIYHISPPIFNHYFFKVQITIPTPSFTITYCGFCSGAKLVDFWTIFEKSHKYEWKIQTKKRHFQTCRTTRFSRSATFCYIYEYILYCIQNFRSFREIILSRFQENDVFSLEWPVGKIGCQDLCSCCLDKVVTLFFCDLGNGWKSRKMKKLHELEILWCVRKMKSVRFHLNSLCLGAGAQ